MSPEYHLYLRDGQRRRIAEVADYSALTFTRRFNGVGAWQLLVPPDGIVAELLTWDGGLIIVRDGVTVLSGPPITRERELSASANTLTLYGVDDMIALRDPLALPSPNGAYDEDGYDTRTGLAGTLLQGYVNDNVGPAAGIAARTVVGLTVGGFTGGAYVSARARFQPLLEVLQGLAISGGDLGFQIVQSGQSLVFSVYETRDRTRDAVFSLENGTLRGYGYTQHAPEVTHATVGGQGEDINRTIIEVDDPDAARTYGRRIEQFADRRDTNDPLKLYQAGRDALTTGAAKTELRLQPIDTAAVVYGRDYQLGDTVTVLVDGVAVQDVVREVQITVQADRGEEVQPTIGTVGAALSPSAVAQLQAQLRQVGRRQSAVERF